MYIREMRASVCTTRVNAASENAVRPASRRPGHWNAEVGLSGRWRHLLVRGRADGVDVQARRVEGLYLPFLVTPLQLKDFFLLAEQLPLSGFSVTIPHKHRIIRYLDAVDPLTKRIGAVNTVYRKAGRWRGTNTDADGIRAPLEKRMRLARASALIVGNGGTARSAAFTLKQAGATIAITGRNIDRVRALAKMAGGEPLAPEQAEARSFDVLIHATPLGMWPHVETCFFRGPIPASLVFDLVYTPRETLLLKRAAAEGREVIPGIEMFLEQAARQFEIFTSVSAPRAAMERAAQRAASRKRGIKQNAHTPYSPASV